MTKTRIVERTRNSVTGRFEKTGYEKKHPDTSEREKIKVPVKKK
jgi:hypothetical protein